LDASGEVICSQAIKVTTQRQSVFFVISNKNLLLKEPKKKQSYFYFRPVERIVVESDFWQESSGKPLGELKNVFKYGQLDYNRSVVALCPILNHFKPSS
jgi:hypothetical protein